MPYKNLGSGGGSGTSTAFTGGGVPWPVSIANNTQPAFSTSQLLADASGEKIACIFRVPNTGTLDKVEFYVGTVVGTASGVRVSFQDVDLTTGFPDGVQDQYRGGVAVASNTWIVPGLMTSDGTDTGTKRSVTRGELLSVVVEFESFAASDAFRILTPSITIAASMHGLFPFNAVYTTSWTKPASTEPFMVLKYNDGTYATVGLQAVPATALTAANINTGTTPDEAGLIFQVPFACKIDRVFANIGSSQDFDVILYDSDGSTVLASVNNDKEVRYGSSGSFFEFILSSDISLLPATNYRLVIKALSASASTNVYYFDVNSTAIMAALPGGSTMHWTQRTDGGAWSQTTTRRPFISLGISAITV